MSDTLRDLLAHCPPDRPVVIAGPTASGKSALALTFAEAQGGRIVNADALQVFAGWPVLTAQPEAGDLARAEHCLYGHMPFDAGYSVGHWLRDVAPMVRDGPRPIIVGGTGLYLSALTEGLAEIPPVPAEVRAEGDALPLDALRRDLDPETAGRIDLANRARVQRAWEVLRTTGRGIADWQSDTAPPLLPPDRATRLVIEAPPDWLSSRIVRRFDRMLDQGALAEASAMRPVWNPGLLSSRAIGARDLVAHLDGEMSLDEVRLSAATATRQYAKRQRTWFRARMAGWQVVRGPALSTSTG